MTDKVTHYDYKAIPRTAFDKRAVKNYSIRDFLWFDLFLKARAEKNSLVFWSERRHQKDISK